MTVDGRTAFVVRGVVLSDAPALDAVGVVSVGALMAWVEFGAGHGAGTSRPVLYLLTALVAVVVAARATAWRHPGVCAQIVAVGILGAFVVTWPGALSAGGGPTGYGNANATLAGLGVVAALGGARAARSAEGRTWLLATGAALGAILVMIGSVAGVATLASVLALVAVSTSVRWPGIAVLGTLLVLLVALALTFAVGRGGDPLGLADRDEVRAELWRAAVDMVDDEPVFGSGSGGFADRRPIDDSDLRWAHNEYLQVAGELGVVGLVSVLSVMACAWLRLWRAAVLARTPASTMVSMSGVHMATAAVAVVSIHATVDWIWHEPVLILVAAALFGAGTGAATAANERSGPLRGNGGGSTIQIPLTSGDGYEAEIHAER